MRIVFELEVNNVIMHVGICRYRISLHFSRFPSYYITFYTFRLFYKILIIFRTMPINVLSFYFMGIHCISKVQIIEVHLFFLYLIG